MAAQVANTLRSLTPPYQRLINLQDYEIILVDNGSPELLSTEVRGLAANLRYHYIPPDRANPSPAEALNFGVTKARAPILCLMVDGARMLSPGVLHRGLDLTRLAPSTVTEVRGWHLGPKVQDESILEGYDHRVERRLLDSISWYDDGYRLFEISVPARSNQRGFLDRAFESNCLFMHRSRFDEIGGFDLRYRTPGGGFLNLEFFRRAVSGTKPVFTLLGEANFHQQHGGAATGLSGPARQVALEAWAAEYARLEGPWTGRPPNYEPILAGHLPPQCRRWLVAD